MSRNYGAGVSRVLDAAARQVNSIIFQEGRPPVDSEFTLLSDLAEDWRRIHTLRGCPSGVIANPINCDLDYVTNPTWSNWFRLGRQRPSEMNSVVWACVNGWLIPVTGTRTGTPPGLPNDSDTWNKITLDPPPSSSGDSRVDFVFLEVWLARIAPNLTQNKPTATTIYRYGNVESGQSYLSDDSQDPDLGFETALRVQLQYRIRVVSGLNGLSLYPDGFDPNSVKAWGSATADSSFSFTNMRKELGDPGLWRAGDGNANALGTVDGYSYAIPLCAVFRRNGVAWDGDPGQNLNGGFNRNPSATNRLGITTFGTVPTVATALTSTATTVTLDSSSGIPLPEITSGVYVQIGDEILKYTNRAGTLLTVARGQLGTKAESHPVGTPVTLLSGRPDGLFSDQIATTDILDLRHVVSPNGFNYDSLLKGSLDKLLSGKLRSTWKRTGGGPQGSFVLHQDKISASTAALGVTRLDAPDGYRTTFSDASMLQTMEFLASFPTSGNDIGTTWGLQLEGTVVKVDTPNPDVSFIGGQVLTIPIGQLDNSLPGSDSDQIRFVTESGAVRIRVDGKDFFLTEGTHYSVGLSGRNLTITLLPAFPSGDAPKRLCITFHVQWGAGRGISRRPDRVHSLAYLNASSNIMLRQKYVPENNFAMSTAWAALWSKYRKNTLHNMLPVTAESYVDLGSKTVILTPFRKVSFPDTIISDGVWLNPGTTITSGSTGVGNGTVNFTDASASFVSPSGQQALVVSSPANVAGTYPIVSRTDATTLVLGREMLSATNVAYSVVSCQGLMPSGKSDGTAKWSDTDPLGLFSGHNAPNVTTSGNLYVQIPRHLVPGWGAVHVPIVHTDTSTFHEGINFLTLTTKGAASTKLTTGELTLIPFDNGGVSYAIFSTTDLNSYPAAQEYNTAITWSGSKVAGVRHFTDTRGLGRKGLELPPFYGIARLFAVYSAQDYIYGNPVGGGNNGSSYDSATREFKAGGAPNLLRQDFAGPAFWIEIDSDGDSTFVLNADVLDLSKCLNPMSSFDAGNFVIEASIFGFDRGSFDLDSDVRLVLSRGKGTRPISTTGMVMPPLVIPAAPEASDDVAINYSRTPYQGDVWGTQQLNQDSAQHLGPVTTANLYQISSTSLSNTLTRPNEKGYEVLASTGFLTTLGTGRLSGDVPTEVYDFRNVGYEDKSAGDPVSSVDSRYPLKLSAISPSSALDIGTTYLGCTDRLPLGSRFLDKDFRGDAISPAYGLNPLIFTDTFGPGIPSSSLANAYSYEQSGITANTPSLASGLPGDIIVQVDGETGNYGLLTNFRTSRGGSAFSAVAPNPGGELSTVFTQSGVSPTYGSVLVGTAYLVRNTVTTVNASEVSAGGELLLVITTTGVPLDPSATSQLKTFIGTNGSGEGYSATDVYRISGHPLEADARFSLIPASIELTHKSDTIFR